MAQTCDLIHKLLLALGAGPGRSLQPRRSDQAPSPRSWQVLLPLRKEAKGVGVKNVCPSSAEATNTRQQRGERERAIALSQTNPGSIPGHLLGILDSPQEQTSPHEQSQEPGLSEHCREMTLRENSQQTQNTPKAGLANSCQLRSARKQQVKSGVWVDRELGGHGASPGVLRVGPGSKGQAASGLCYLPPSPEPRDLSLCSTRRVCTCFPGERAMGPPSTEPPAPAPRLGSRAPRLPTAKPLIPTACFPPAKAPLDPPRGAPGSGALRSPAAPPIAPNRAALQPPQMQQTPAARSRKREGASA